MLLESDVIDAVCIELESRGYRILQRLQANQRGDDIIAVKQTTPVHALYIEAKGETSSKTNSNRYGQPFGSDQIRDHVAMAFYKAAQVLSRQQEEVEVRAGIALPNTYEHHARVRDIEPVLTQLGIATFWVQQDRSVRIVSSWIV